MFCFLISRGAPSYLNQLANPLMSHSGQGSPRDLARGQAAPLPPWLIIQTGTRPLLGEA